MFDSDKWKAIQKETDDKFKSMWKKIEEESQRERQEQIDRRLREAEEAKDDKEIRRILRESREEQIYDFEVHEKEAYLDYYEYKRNYRESHPEEFVNNHGWFNDRDD